MRNIKELKLIILDRDGVINYDSAEYIKTVDEWQPIPGSLSAIAKLKKAGYLIGVATNQSGIGRGYYTETTLHAMHEKMQNLLAVEQASIDAILFCPHAPDENCLCRKPKSEMIINLMKHFSALPEQTLVIGDSWRDIESGKNVGCHTALVLTGKGNETFIKHQNNLNNEQVFDDLQNLTQNILSIPKKNNI